MEGGEEIEHVSESYGYLCPGAPPRPPVPLGGGHSWTGVLDRGSVKSCSQASGPSPLVSRVPHSFGAPLTARVLVCLLVYSLIDATNKQNDCCRVPCVHLLSVHCSSGSSVVEC